MGGVWFPYGLVNTNGMLYLLSTLLFIVYHYYIFLPFVVY
jgi:hypothetical protein